ADPDLVVFPQARLLDRAAVEVDAVVAAEVPDLVALAVAFEGAVMARDTGPFEHDVVVGRSPHRVARVQERQLRELAGALADRQFGHFLQGGRMTSKPSARAAFACASSLVNRRRR